MAAGDALTGASWEHEIRGYLLGTDTAWCIDNVTGWVGKTTKSADTDRTLGDGTVSGPDFRGARVIVLDMYCTLASDTAAFTAVAALETAWAESATDIALHATLPYRGHVYVNGRPRDLVIDDMRLSAWGRLDAQAVFYCPDPTITEV